MQKAIQQKRKRMDPPPAAMGASHHSIASDIRCDWFVE
jgi:hypothetical protein